MSDESLDATATPEVTQPLPAPTWLPALIVSAGMGLITYSWFFYVGEAVFFWWMVAATAIVSLGGMLGYSGRWYLAIDGLYLLWIVIPLGAIVAGQWGIVIATPLIWVAVIFPYAIGLLAGFYTRQAASALGFCDEYSIPSKLFSTQFSLRAMFAGTALVALVLLPLSLWVRDWSTMWGALPGIGAAYLAVFVTFAVSPRHRGQLARTAQRRLP